jgi:hypothetical protein
MFVSDSLLENGYRYKQRLDTFGLCDERILLVFVMRGSRVHDPHYSRCQAFPARNAEVKRAFLLLLCSHFGHCQEAGLEPDCRLVVRMYVIMYVHTTRPTFLPWKTSPNVCFPM